MGTGGNKPGMRAGAMQGADNETVYLYGYGVYEGNFPPVEASGMMAEVARELGSENPRIRLDDGGVVYGCECWWGPEEKIRASIGDRKVVMVSIDDARKEASGSTAEPE